MRITKWEKERKEERKKGRKKDVRIWVTEQLKCVWQTRRIGSRIRDFVEAPLFHIPFSAVMWSKNKWNKSLQNMKLILQSGRKRCNDEVLPFNPPPPLRNTTMLFLCDRAMLAVIYMVSRLPHLKGRLFLMCKWPLNRIRTLSESKISVPICWSLFLTWLYNIFWCIVMTWNWLFRL
jgi:hypothetical protein